MHSTSHAAVPITDRVPFEVVTSEVVTETVLDNHLPANQGCTPGEGVGTL